MRGGGLRGEKILNRDLEIDHVRNGEVRQGWSEREISRKESGTPGKRSLNTAEDG